MILWQIAIHLGDSLGDGDKHLFTLDREPMTDQGMDVPKVQVGEPVNFIEVLYRKVGKSDLQAQKCLKDSCTTKAHHIMNDSSPKLGIWSSLHSQQTSTGWRTSLPVGLSLFQEALLVLVPSSHSCCSLLRLGYRAESGFQKSLLFSFLWVRVSLYILYWPWMCRRSDWLHTQFAWLRDQDHHVLQCPSNPCPFVCFFFSMFWEMV